VTFPPSEADFDRPFTAGSALGIFPMTESPSTFHKRASANRLDLDPAHLRIE